MRYNLVDLHTHSCCSDGLLPPVRVAEEACNAGLRALSLTDHDTVAGIDEVLRAGERLNLEIIPGIELSAHIRDREVHLLVYFLEWKAPQLATHLNLLRQQRRERGQAIVEHLHKLGMELSLEEVLEQTSGGPLGRPHIAAVMVGRGLVASRDEAFDRFLGDHAPAFEPKPYLAVRDVIELVHGIGGVAVLAHPGTSFSEAMIIQLVNAGLDGVEVFHPAHQAPQIEHYKQLAARYGLLQSGGSDSHGGPENPRVGECGIGYDAVETLRERAATYA